EQDPAERHALTRRTQADFAQHRLDVVPRTAVQLGAHGSGNAVAARRHDGRLHNGTLLRHGGPRLLLILTNEIISGLARFCNSFATALPSGYNTAPGAVEGGNFARWVAYVRESVRHDQCLLERGRHDW